MWSAATFDLICDGFCIKIGCGSFIRIEESIFIYDSDILGRFD